MTNDERFEVFDRAARLRREGVPFALATVTLSQQPTSARPGAKAVITTDGAVFGWVGGACSQPSVVRHAREAIEVGEPRVVRLSPDGGGPPREGVIELAMTCHSGGTLEIFIEPFRPDPYLVVAGDSPVARALVGLGRQLGFHTAAMACPDADADEQYPDLAFDRLSPHRTPFVVVASMGALDEEALLQATRLDPPYLALVGSRRRFAALADYLRASGVEETRIAAIRAPAGLDIRAETPTEIALSILAEIVAARREISYRLPEAHPIEQPRVVIDPVCGMEIELATARWTVERDGALIAFCCPACKREYEKRTA
jgi:xanthine dehydrogenase accessory factor